MLHEFGLGRLPLFSSRWKEWLTRQPADTKYSKDNRKLTRRAALTTPGFRAHFNQMTLVDKHSASLKF